MNIKISPTKNLKGKIDLPGDKSISHRSVIIGSLSDGKVVVENFLDCEDTSKTVEAFRNLGVDILFNEEGKLVILGVGLRGLRKPTQDLYLGNSATSMRLMLGVLSGQRFRSRLTGDASLNSRPMGRVTLPLSKMGAKFDGKDKANYAPITVWGGPLKAICYSSPVASAQVKSAILLAGLYAEGITKVSEPYKSRDHTERLLSYFGTNVKVEGNRVSIHPVDSLKSRVINIPGDISSAMFFILAGLVIPDSKIVIREVGINPTRIGALKVLREMGAKIRLLKKRNLHFEPSADIIVESSTLHGITIGREIIPSAIDELPLIMVAGCFAKGVTKIYGASELRVKETDRIESMVSGLRRMGAHIEVDQDDVFVHGSKLMGSEVESFYDHRTAMSLTIAGIACSKGYTVINNVECVKTSFPQFFDILNELKVRYEIIK